MSIRTTFSRFSFGFQLLLGSFLVSIILVVLVGQIVRYLEQGYLLPEFAKRSQVLISTLAGASIDAVITEDLSLLDTIIDQTVERNPGVQAISIENEHHTLLVKWQHNEIDIARDADLYTYSRPIELEGEVFGFINVEWDLSADKARINRHTSVMMGVACVALLITIGIILAIIHMLALRPLSRVQSALANLSNESMVEGLDQVRLSREFSRIVDAVQTLAGSKRELELQVKNRTEELAEANILLQVLVRKDALTGLSNRRALDEYLREIFLRWKRHSVVYSVLLIDLDNFKKINDTHGHKEGDEVLVQVAGALKATLRETDFAARFGGDEMLAVLPGTSASKADKVAGKIMQAVTKLSCQSYGPVTLSIGVAQVSEDHQDETGILEDADKCLYKAKAAGRNQSVAMLVD